MAIPEMRKLVVVARSARMLAQLAIDSGYSPFAIDCFMDDDTRRMANVAIQVASLEPSELIGPLNSMRSDHQVRQLVVGSGFETCLESLDCLSDWDVLANSAKLFRVLQDKRAFFSCLDALGIDYPETRFTPPENLEGWLLKTCRGEGGIGIEFASDLSSRRGGDDTYWQRYLEGNVYSVLFVANGERCQMVGFNQQWTVDLGVSKPLVFSGISNLAPLESRHRRRVKAWLQALLSHYPLRGLCSLDFMISENRCYLLEINPRIPASAQLYGKSALDWHIKSMRGDWPFPRKFRTRPRGFQVVYASTEVRVPERVAWPSWAVDLPSAGAIVGKGQPLCSIIAGGKNAVQVRERLLWRQKNIEYLLNIGC